MPGTLDAAHGRIKSMGEASAPGVPPAGSPRLPT
jgi:hypothetical protein